MSWKNLELKRSGERRRQKMERRETRRDHDLNSLGVPSFDLPVIDCVPGGPPEGSVC